MAHRGTLDLLPLAESAHEGKVGRIAPTPLRTRIECLEQILRAFRDIADCDDIHQAAGRLALVQEWIRDEAGRAAADPIFAELRLV